MSVGLAAILLLFAGIGYGGAGAALAVARGRRAAEEEQDFGMLGVTILLLTFASLCSAVLGGIAAVLAIGLALAGAGYIHTAQRLGSFQVGCGRLDAMPAEEPRHTL